MAEKPLQVEYCMTYSELLNLVARPNSHCICVDSRLVKTGDIFVAVEGTTYDGHDFIDQAIANGAEYIVCRKQSAAVRAPDRQCRIIAVDDPAQAAALLAQADKGNPASQLTNLAVTGTNGKTTVAYLVRSCIQTAGQKCGLIGTVVYDTGDQTHQADLTTPDCLAIADVQSQMIEAGTKYMVIEASSHALSQNRLAGIDFTAAAFTNIAGDHLDYHQTGENYLAAKTRLFQTLERDAVAVLNKQSPQAAQIAAQTNAKILWYAVDSPADMTANVRSMDITGTTFILNYDGAEQIVKTPLPGTYNVSNHLAAAGLCLAAGLDLETVARGLSALEQIPGRLEKVDSNYGFSVIIDYAHTDDALKNVLVTLKPLCKGSLTVVFGCGGDRDRTKRPRMGKVAEDLADSVIVTSDNPRTERPEDIIDEIVLGLKDPHAATVAIEPDRRKAIELAIDTAAEDDILLIAGKGHEDYQIIGTQKFHFDDKEIAEQCLLKQS
jgi:UDP-N-acetylmuramoyl-L-alanyl-D-glutamate--2,6-diaminopimelate ligase